MQLKFLSFGLLLLASLQYTFSMQDNIKALNIKEICGVLQTQNKNNSYIYTRCANILEKKKTLSEQMRLWTYEALNNKNIVTGTTKNNNFYTIYKGKSEEPIDNYYNVTALIQPTIALLQSTKQEIVARVVFATCNTTPKFLLSNTTKNKKTALVLATNLTSYRPLLEDNDMDAVANADLLEIVAKIAQQDGCDILLIDCSRMETDPFYADLGYQWQECWYKILS